MGPVQTESDVVATPSRAAYRPVLGALISAVLPLEDPRFPQSLTPLELERVLLELFPLDDDPELVDVPASMMLFDDCELFDREFAPLVHDQRSHGADEAAAAQQDRALFADYAERFGTGRFSLQPLAARRAYLALWSRSGWLARRRIYRGYKALVLISAYSTRALWDSIGYDGPRLQT